MYLDFTLTAILTETLYFSYLFFLCFALRSNPIKGRIAKILLYISFGTLSSQIFFPSMEGSNPLVWAGIYMLGAWSIWRIIAAEKVSAWIWVIWVSHCFASILSISNLVAIDIGHNVNYWNTYFSRLLVWLGFVNVWCLAIGDWFAEKSSIKRILHVQ